MNIFSRNIKDNKNIALVILIVLGLANLGVFTAVGLNLNSFAIPFIPGWTLLTVLSTIGVLWVAYGLHENKIK